MHPKLKLVFSGVDIHRRTHSAVFINAFGEKLGEIKFENKPSAFEGFLKEAKKLLKRGQSLVWGLEDCEGSGRPLAVFLKSKGLVVKKVNSNLSAAERKSQPGNGKTDFIDAENVARVLLTRLDILPDFSQTDIYWTIGTLVRKRASIVNDNIILKNQVQAYIIQHYPSYKSFFSVFDCATGLEFWERFPSPSRLKTVTVEELGKMLYQKSSGFFDVVKAKAIFEAVEKDGDTGTEFQESRDFIVSSCIKEIKHNNDEISKTEKEIKKLMKTLPYQLETMKGVDFVTAAAIIAEVGDIRRFANADKLAKFAGCSPVSHSSGDTERNIRNKYGNRRLYYIFQGIAARNVSAGRNKDKPVNGIFYEYYNRKISQGKTSSQAIKAVTRRVINIIYGLMKSGNAYVHPQTFDLQAQDKKAAEN
jgi:transposase